MRTSIAAFFLSLMICSASRGQAQSWLGASSFFGHQPDARSEAMGRGNVALQGDVRNMSFNPAALMDLHGLDVYLHSADKWYTFENSEFEQGAMTYRIGERWSFGTAVDGSSISSEHLTFGDMIEPRRGFIYQTEDGFVAPTPRLMLALASAPIEDLNVGIAVGNIPLDKEDQDVVYRSLGLSHGGELPTTGSLHHAIRVGASMQNLTFSEESSTVYHMDYFGQVDTSYQITDRIPAIFRGGFGYTARWRSGWLCDTLPTVAFTAHVQYDDDLTQRNRSAMRIGCEVLILDILAVRGGWYRESVDDQELPNTFTNALEQFTYGFGVQLPLGALTKGKAPIVIGFDYTSLPQVSYYADGLGIHDEPWENFQSIGLRLNYGFGPIFKRKTPKNG
jgi:hypothetical protein